MALTRGRGTRDAVQTTTIDGETVDIPAMLAVDANGLAAGSAAYMLASNQTVAGVTSTAPVVGLPRGVYVFDAQFTGTSIKLQSLGADGLTWRDVLTMTSSGTYAGDIRFGANATVRLYNPNATADTAVSAVLS